MKELPKLPPLNDLVVAVAKEARLRPDMKVERCTYETCLVGCAARHLGCDLMEYEHGFGDSSIQNIYADEDDRVVFDVASAGTLNPGPLRWLAQAQTYQDAGKPWGEAVKAACDDQAGQEWLVKLQEKEEELCPSSA